jgi:poly-gamma-glutamate synthesis protein (capsule biosynthesis protein)
MVKISFVGDTFLANLHYTIGYGVGSKLFNSSLKINQVTKDSLFPKSEFVVANLEAPLFFYNHHEVDKNCFGGWVEYNKLLGNLGIEVVNIANNHIMEYGSEGYKRTLEALDQEKIFYTGHAQEIYSNELLIKIEGINFGFLGYSLIEDHSVNKLYAFSGLETILSHASRFSKKCDHLILLLHWGDEFILQPTVEQIEFGHKLIDSGVRVIIGHHPHVYQGMELFNEGIIYYSLGNFIFDMLWSFDTRWGMIATIDFSKDGIVGFENDPIWISNNYSPKIPTGNNAKLIKNRIKKINRTVLNKSSNMVERKYYGLLKKTITFSHRLKMKYFLLSNYHRADPRIINKIISKKIKRGNS